MVDMWEATRALWGVLMRCAVTPAIRKTMRVLLCHRLTAHDRWPELSRISYLG